jgi:hypothetical protein
MKKRRILITTLLLLSIIINVPTVFAEQSKLTIPPIIIENVKGIDELTDYARKLKQIRLNIESIDINALTAKDKASEIEKQVNFYITQLKEIETSTSSFKKKYSNSEPDLLLAEQIGIITQSYKMSLNQVLNLLNLLVNNNLEASKLFYSRYLNYIYYYLSLGDQIASYISTFYNLRY